MSMIVSHRQDAILRNLAERTGESYNVLKTAEQRMFETIIRKGDMTPRTAEEVFKRQVDLAAEKMLDTFTWEENVMICFVPLIISQLAWTYAERVLTYCASHRISETTKLCRAVKHIKTEYENMVLIDLSYDKFMDVKRQAAEFADLYAKDFYILWFSVNARYKQLYPNEFLVDMKTDAYIGILMCRYLAEHNKRMAKLISTKMGSTDDIANPFMVRLETCLDAYCGDQVITDDYNIRTAMKIIHNKLMTSEFYPNGKPQNG